MNVLRIDGEERTIEGNATFLLFVRSERVNLQDGSWQDEPMVSERYDVELVVDEDSGEDGALAPSASVRALHEDSFRLQLPLGDALVLEPHEGHWEGVLGNDSWLLERNRLVIREFDGRSAKLLWTAVWGREGEHAFEYDGAADFLGIFVWAHLEADLDRAIAGLWSASLLANRLEKTNVKVDDRATPPLWSAMYQFRWAKGPSRPGWTHSAVA